MLSAPSIVTLGALARMENDSDFALVRQWLGQSLSDIDQRNRQNRDEVDFRQGQGASQVLAEFEQHCVTARESLSRIDAQKQRAETLKSGASL